MKPCQCGCGLPIDGKGRKYRTACSMMVQRGQREARAGTLPDARNFFGWRRYTKMVLDYLRASGSRKRERSEEDGIERIAQEMIEQALADIKREPQSGEPDEKPDAIKWFSERSLVVFGYGWCLGLSGYNPNTIRRIINKFQ